MLKRKAMLVWVIVLVAGVAAGTAVPGLTQGDESACVVTSIEGAVLRSGPGTFYERRSALATGESAVVVNSEKDAGGQTWWQLEAGAWVREDLVTESPGCEGFTGVVLPEGISAEACVVTSINGAVTRSGPGTEYGMRAPLAAGDSADVVDSEKDAGGQTWWQLATGEWVREDLVSESEGCASLGELVVETGEFGEDACVVVSINGAVTRSGPGTDYERRGPLAAGESALVVDSQPDAGGQTWWKLESGAWVREDLVAESDACASLGAGVDLSTVGEDTCVVVSISGSTLRSGPGTDYETRGALATGESRLAVDQSTDAGGQTWWRLSSGAWVREDLVTESAGCTTMSGPAPAAEEVPPEACVVTSISGAVTRSGPGTDYETRGPLAAGESAAAVDSRDDAGGQTWWQLATGEWVREDLVTESAGCETMGQVTAPSDVEGGACVVTSISGAVTRSGPGTDNEARAPLLAGESRDVIAARRDLGGQTWWQLTTGEWVREDLVYESAGCEALK